MHKANVLSVSDGLWRETALEVATEFPNIRVEEQIVDSMVYFYLFILIMAAIDYSVSHSSST